MSSSLNTEYKFITQELDEYVQDCVNTAAATTHGYKKKEAALRADGAVRFWMKLFVASHTSMAHETRQSFEDDMVRLRTTVGNIPTEDQP